jgi:hypothetical protein
MLASVNTEPQMSDDMETVEIGALIPDPEVFRDLSITPMTGYRWDRDSRMAELGWPPPIYRGRYKFREANQYRKFKANLLRQALARRATLLKQHIKASEEPRGRVNQKRARLCKGAPFALEGPHSRPSKKEPIKCPVSRL